MAVLLDAFPGRFVTEILTEVYRLPIGMLDEILEAKAYRHAKAMVDAADTDEARKRLPKGALFTLVDEIEEDLVLEAIEAEARG